MTLKKTDVVDQIVASENGVVFYRTITRIVEDGKQPIETYHRTSLSPGQDVSAAPAEVQEICATAWTPEVVQSFGVGSV